jgi:hypothetical protein
MGRTTVWIALALMAPLPVARAQAGAPDGQPAALTLRASVKVAELVAAAAGWSKTECVELKGEYRGSRARPGRPLEGVEAPEGTDWILGDETGEVWVHNGPGAEVDVHLNPEWSYGTRVVVRGTVETYPDGRVSVRPVQVFKWQADRGAFCVLEVSGPPETPNTASRPGEQAPRVLLRMIFKNDTRYPVRLARLAGRDHDFVVERDGQEVWRWSRHQSPGMGLAWREVAGWPWKPGPGSPPADRSILKEEQTERNAPTGRITIPPDNAYVFTAYWSLTDNQGAPAPQGLYQIYGVISHRVFTYGVPFPIGAPPEQPETR